MTSLDPTNIGLFVLLAGIGLAMVRSAGRYNLLESRHRGRRCPSCGRLIVGRRCPCVS